MKHIILLITIYAYSLHVQGQTVIDVVENTFKVTALGEELFYYGFAEGDQMIFNFQEVNGKELKEIEVIALPSSSKFMDYKTSLIENKKINITSTGVYKFRFANSAISGRVCKVKIQRIPSSDQTKNFKTDVFWRTAYDTTVNIVKERYLSGKEYKVERIIKEKYYINSGSNAMFKGGKSRITVPVIVPNNTVELYYTFAASRDLQQIEQTHKTINLAGELTRLIDPSGAINIVAGMLSTPPGGDVCDVYMLSQENRALFEAKAEFRYLPEGSRENIASGTVQIKATKLPHFFLGIKNPSGMDGVNVSLELDAITLNEKWENRDVRKDIITSREEAYLKN